MTTMTVPASVRDSLAISPPSASLPRFPALRVPILVVLCLVLPIDVAAVQQVPSPPPAYVEALAGSTINGTETGAAIFATCITGRNGEGSVANQQFQQNCNNMVLGSIASPNAGSQAMSQVAADQIDAQNGLAIRTAELGVAVVQNRLERIRLANLAPNQAPIAIAKNALLGPQTGGAASADSSFGKLGVYFTLEDVFGAQDETKLLPGYDVRGWSFLGGADYRLTDQFLAGLALRYADSDYQYDRDRGNMTGESWGAIAYANWDFQNGFFIDGSLAYASNDYTLKRQIQYALSDQTIAQIAKSNPSAALWGLDIGAGYTFYREAWSFTPALRLSWLNNQVDSFREQMSNPSAPGGGFALAIDSQTYKSFTSDLGFQISRAISYTGGVLIPQLRFSWIHEFENDQQQVGATFVNDINSQPLFVLTAEPDENYFQLGIGLAAQLPKGRSFFVSFNTLLGYKDVTYSAVSAGVRLEF